ncbi:response regulator transcription factor [Novosphingobium rosa]|uniref:response regulator transcription factor n=1 Tax=Novosphingobium rosa TaxID=76978 RepID=UPI00082D5E11|nr:response regulator transcription factor [Novosphingobium rosa]
MILLVEDDVAIGSCVSQGLATRGFPIRWLRRGSELLDQVNAGEVRVVILDLGLPDGDGLDLCRQLRAQGHRMPVLMLTARAALDDRLEGFEAGTDDYLPKPFAFAELVARITVLARRAEQLAPAPIAFGSLSVDQARGQILRHGAKLTMEPKAHALLLQLAARRGGLMPRQTLIDTVWGEDSSITDNTLDVSISILRRRLAEYAPELTVRAVKGQGVQLVCDLIP